MQGARIALFNAICEETVQSIRSCAMCNISSGRCSKDKCRVCNKVGDDTKL